MEIIQFEPEDRINRDKFINLPFKLYQNTPNWVPPLDMDIRKILTASLTHFINIQMPHF